MKYLIVIVLTGLLLSGCSLSQPQASLTDTSASGGNTQKQDNNKLDLSNQQLSKIPGNIFNWTHLEELNLSGNQLTGAIQGEIRQLKNLKILNAGNNLMTGVPAEIGQLENLEILDLSDNRLTGLPYELGNLKNLKTFNISGNNYSTADLDRITEKLPANVEIIK